MKKLLLFILFLVITNITIADDDVVKCGDGVCDSEELRAHSCGEDCLPDCGNGVCSIGEEWVTCPKDCPQPKCYDSDGKDAYTKGETVVESGKKYYDRCKSTNAVREFYCNGNLFSGVNIECSTGDICRDGKCVTPDQASDEVKCNDVDGLDVHIKSTVTTSKGGYTDYCVSLLKVGEYTCGQIDPMLQEIYCPTGEICEAGKCVKKQENTLTGRVIEEQKEKEQIKIIKEEEHQQKMQQMKEERKESLWSLFIKFIGSLF